MLGKKSATKKSTVKAPDEKLIKKFNQKFILQK
jgi:hypothetical protein